MMELATNFRMMEEGPLLKNSLAAFSQVLVQKKGIVFVYVVLCLVTALLIAILCSLISTPALFYWVKALQILLFTRMGMLNGSLVKKYLPFLQVEHEGYSIFFPSFIAILICAVLALFYMVIDGHLLIMAFACSSAFLMPALVSEALYSLTSIPEKQYRAWYVDEVTDDTVSIFLNSIQIEIQLAKKYFDISDTIYNVTVPVQVPFGKFFNRFISGRNRAEPNSIELTDDKRKRYGWEFYVEGFGGLSKKHIDPDLPLVENRVKQNTKIIAKRISNVKKQQNLIPQKATNTKKNRQ